MFWKIACICGWLVWIAGIYNGIAIIFPDTVSPMFFNLQPIEPGLQFPMVLAFFPLMGALVVLLIFYSLIVWQD